MSTFTPPSQNAVPPVLPDRSPEQTRLGYRLFRHYRSRPEGINVYLMSDGSVTEDDPDGNSSFWAAGEGTPYVSVAWYGGHDNYDITAAQATLLQAAGYSAYVS